MFNEEAVAQFNELINILKDMPIPPIRRDLTKDKNVRWLRRSIKPEWHQNANRALELLELCDNTEEDYCGSTSPVWQDLVRQSHVDRDKLVQKYLEKGFEVTSNSWPGNPPKVYAVKLNFTPEEWLDLMNTEGEFLPACCATISNIRDVLMSTLRDGGFINASELHEVVEALKDHHDCDSEGNDPLNRLLQTWETIKDEAEIHLTGHPVDPNELEDAFNILYRSSAVLSWNFLTHEPNEDDKYNHKMVQYMEFIRVLPAIHTIYKSLKEKGLEPMTGYAITDGDEVLSLRMGLAIFRTEERAEELAKEFNDEEDKRRKNDKKRRLEHKRREKVYGNQDEYRPTITHFYTVRPVKVSIENGIEFLDK